MRRSRLCVFLLLLTCALLLSSCAKMISSLMESSNNPKVREERGLHNFQRAIASLYLQDEPIHNDLIELLDAHPYEKGNFDSYCVERGFSVYETVVMYLCYQEDEYLKTKEDVLKNMMADDAQTQEYRGYHFSKVQGELECSNIYLAYSDDTCTLIFLSTYMSSSFAKEITSLEQYVDLYFSFFDLENLSFEEKINLPVTVQTIETTMSSTQPKDSEPSNFTSSSAFAHVFSMLES